MGFELAIYLGEPKRIDVLERTIKETFARSRVARGDELLEKLRPYIEGDLRRPLLLLLYREGVLKRLKAAPSIEDYLFALEAAKARDFFTMQRVAAEVVQEAGLKTKRWARSVELVATLPAKVAIDREIPGIGSLDAAIRRLIVSASEIVWVVNPFFDHFGAAAIEGPLVGRAKKGVNIRIVGRDLLSEGSVRHQNIEPLVWLTNRFRESGVQDMLQIRDFTKRDKKSGRITYALHSKIVLSDSKACYLGSANVTETSLRMNFELGVVLYGSNVGPVRSLVTHLWAASTVVELPGG